MNLPYDVMIGLLNHTIRDLADPRHATVLVDATGCGQPFIDILRKHKLGVLITPIGITSTGTGSYHNGIERVSKKALMAAAGYVMMSQALTVEPGMAGLAELREEMESFRVHTFRSGSDGFRGGQGLRPRCLESPPIPPNNPNRTATVRERRPSSFEGARIITSSDED